MLSPFVLVDSMHGPLIVNILDTGVSERVIAVGTHELWIIDLVKFVANLQRKHRNFITVADVGANIGVNAVAWSKHLRGWGQVVSFEPQERLFYALAGNIALNNCGNATAHLLAVGSQRGVLSVPRPNYHKPHNFGGLSAIPDFIGTIDRDKITEFSDVMMLPLDNCNLGQVDILKIDVEGMEPDVLEGAQETIKNYRPVVVAEVLADRGISMKELAQYLHGYECWPVDTSNVAAWHRDDPISTELGNWVQEHRHRNLGD